MFSDLFTHENPKKAAIVIIQNGSGHAVKGRGSFQRWHSASYDTKG